MINLPNRNNVEKDSHVINKKIQNIGLVNDVIFLRGNI